MTTPTATRIAGIAARLASPHDGEALAAARLYVRELERLDMRPEQLVERAFSELKLNETTDPVPDHVRRARELLGVDGILSPRDREFLRSIAQLSRPTITVAQADWLADLELRARHRASRAA